MIFLSPRNSGARNRCCKGARNLAYVSSDGLSSPAGNAAAFRRLVRKGYIQPAAEACRIHQSGGDMSAASFDALGTDRVLGSDAYRAEDFPGCEPFHLPASEIEHCEGRLEFWDGVTETAWKVCEPTSIQHEQPSRRLVRMAERIASLRGSAIECFGSADLVRLGAAGRKRWLMQADEVLYLDPDRVRLQGPAIDVDEDPPPEVVLEVDHTTDVRQLVDLAISRQLSEAVPSADTSLAGSPTILNRQISTSLTLRDGGSLLMGGLISGNQGAGTTGVPVLGQLPVLGRLFRTDAVQEDRTELMVMVTPYVIADHEEGWELTRRIREQFDLHTEIQR